MQKQAKIKHFCFSDPKKNNNYSQIFVAEPNKNFLEKFGQLCILINLNFQDESKADSIAQGQKWSQEIIDLIKNDFYNPLREADDIEKELEDSLQKINKWIQKEKTNHQEFFEKDLLNFDIDIVVIKDEQIYFSQIGDIETYLLKDEKLINLVDDRNTSTKFLNIVSGQLQENSLLFFANKEIFDYFSQQKINQLFGQTSFNEVEKQIKKFLKEEINQNNFFFLIISNREEEEKEENQEEEKEKKDENLKEEVKERKEEKKEKEEKKSKKEKKEKEQQPKEKIKQEQEQEKEKERKKEVKEEKKENLFKKEKISKKARKIKKDFINPPITKTSRLKYFRKYLLIFIIILALLFVQSIFILARKQIKARRAQEYAQAIEKIENVQQDLNLALTSKNNDKIEEEINKFKNLLAQLPQETEEEEENYKILKQEYIEQMSQFYNLNNILEPKLLIDLKEEFPEININKMTNIGNNFYILNSENNYIYLFNIENKNLELINNHSANIGRIKKISAYDSDNLIGLDQNQNIVNFNIVDKELSLLNFNREEKPIEIKDFYIYNQRFYTLEPQDNQIFKHEKTIDGFGEEQAWIKDNDVNINQGVSLAIDGSIYVLKENGEIIRLYQGEKTNFEIENLQPVISLQDPNIINSHENIKLITDLEMDNIYLLDGPSKRLIIFDKNGKLINQFTSPEFISLKDVIISKQENKAWLLSETKIFEIDL